MSLRISLTTICQRLTAYENIIKTIHDIDPQRMILAPRLRAAPEDLTSLKLPA
jgi:hypothetical protein